MRLSDISVSSSRARRPPRARDGSALHSLTALPSPLAVIKLTRVYKSAALCAAGFVLLTVVSRRWVSVCVWGVCHLITLLIKSKQATVFRCADSADPLDLSRTHTSAVFPKMRVGWRTGKTFMKFTDGPRLDYYLSRSLSLFADIRAAHSSLVLIKSNRNKPEAITPAARWADLRGDPPGAWWHPWGHN